MGVEKIGLETDDLAMIRGLVHIKTASSSCELLAVFCYTGFRKISLNKILTMTFLPYFTTATWAFVVPVLSPQGMNSLIFI